MSSAYAAGSLKVIIRYKILAKFQALLMFAYSLFNLLLCTNPDWAF